MNSKIQNSFFADMDEISLKSGMTVHSALQFKDLRPFDRPLMSQIAFDPPISRKDAERKMAYLHCLSFLT
jgi:hypothetical protein